jgi:hypothetical protein
LYSHTGTLSLLAGFETQLRIMEYCPDITSFICISVYTELE